jgi:ABC-2 type transport system ATP-binding protein
MVDGANQEPELFREGLVRGESRLMRSCSTGRDSMKMVIETDDLVKRFREVTAVDRVSLRVAQGEIYAFLGLNGAGKTTTIRLLLGMVRPTSGEARVLGTRIRVGHKKPWDSVGTMVETPDAYPQLSVRENLEAVRRLRPGTEPGAVERVIERLGLTEYADRRAGTLSHGNAQRLGLAKALLHNPALLVLDEPANGLDPAGIVEIRNLLIDLAQNQGVTVFMSSHILGEVSRLAKRIGIIHQGRLLQELDVDELERHRRRRLVVRARDGRAAHSVLVNAGFSASMAPDGTIEVKDTAAIGQPDEVATRLVQAGHAPTMLTVEEEDLEHYFLRLVGMDAGGAQ